MRAAIVIAIIALAALINVAAVRAGRMRGKALHRLAMLFGCLGLFCLFGLLVAVADAFTQIWVQRPGYQGLPVLVFFYATISATLGSLTAAVAIAVDDRRAEA